MIQNDDVKTWFAADWPASERALDMRPTQKRSMAPMSGFMAKLRMAGRETWRAGAA